MATFPHPLFLLSLIVARLPPLKVPHIVGLRHFIHMCFRFCTYLATFSCTTYVGHGAFTLMHFQPVCFYKQICYGILFNRIHATFRYEALQASATISVSQRWNNFCSMVGKNFWINFGTQSTLRHTAFRISKKNCGL